MPLSTRTPMPISTATAMRTPPTVTAVLPLVRPPATGLRKASSRGARGRGAGGGRRRTWPSAPAAGGRQQLAVAREGDGGDRLVVAAEGRPGAAARHVPQPGLAVLAGGRRHQPARPERYRQHLVLVAGPGGHLAAAGRLVQSCHA